MSIEALDAIELLARLNPVPPERLDELADGPERDTTYARITAWREGSPACNRRLPRRRLLAAAIVVALAIPALALSGGLGSLFGFSNEGTPISVDNLASAGSFGLTGALPGSVVQLAGRDGVGVYAAKSSAGGPCYFVGPADQADLQSEGLGGGCLNENARFPSPAQPVVDLSLFESAPSGSGGTASGPNVSRLEGVAADGVASVQVLALADCHVVATVPVIDNVYVSTNLPVVPEAQIVARDASGNAVWHEAVAPGNDPPECGIG